METTMDLLAKALQIAPMPVWTEKFKLSRNAISTAKASGHLTPVIAGHFAIELNEEPEKWMSRAVIEGEKASPAKDQLIKRMKHSLKL